MLTVTKTGEGVMSVVGTTQEFDTYVKRVGYQPLNAEDQPHPNAEDQPHAGDPE